MGRNNVSHYVIRVLKDNEEVDLKIPGTGTDGAPSLKEAERVVTKVLKLKIIFTTTIFYPKKRSSSTEVNPPDRWKGFSI